MATYKKNDRAIFGQHFGKHSHRIWEHRAELHIRLQDARYFAWCTVFHDRDFFTFASPLPTVKPRFWALIRPFDTIVWVMNVVTIIASGMIFYVISNIEVNFVDKALN